MSPAPSRDAGQRPLEIAVRRKAETAVVRISGSASMDVCDRIRDELIPLAEGDVRLIVLDLADLDFICSEGLGAIVAAYLKSVNRGGSVRLAQPSKAARELLTITKLDKLFHVFASVEEALLVG